MGIIILGATSGVGADTDSNKNIYVRRGIPHYGATAGSFSVSGGATSVVAASLASTTNLMSARNASGSATNIYLTRLRVTFAVATVGASAGVPGQIAWQRFTALTPTGGTARTPARKDTSTGSSTTNLSDVRDSNAALTGSAPTWGDILSICNVPNFTTGGAYEWVMDLEQDEWIRLTNGDGIGLRTQSAMPATQTWVYTYTMHYIEK